MTVRLDNASLIPGGITLSVYSGLGIPFENTPTDGDQGGSPLRDDGGVAGQEIRWGPVTITSGVINVEIFEDGSFESTGGAGSFTYPWWRNGVYQGIKEVIIGDGGTVISGIIAKVYQGGQFITGQFRVFNGTSWVNATPRV